MAMSEYLGYLDKARMAADRVANMTESASANGVEGLEPFASGAGVAQKSATGGSSLSEHTSSSSTQWLLKGDEEETSGTHVKAREDRYLAWRLGSVGTPAMGENGSFRAHEASTTRGG
jgi:hypothetical protein